MNMTKLFVLIFGLGVMSGCATTVHYPDGTRVTITEAPLVYYYDWDDGRRYYYRYQSGRVVYFHRWYKPPRRARVIERRIDHHHHYHLRDDGGHKPRLAPPPRQRWSPPPQRKESPPPRKDWRPRQNDRPPAPSYSQDRRYDKKGETRDSRRQQRGENPPRGGRNDRDRDRWGREKGYFPYSP